MRNQRGDFLLQALLALRLIVAFAPFLTQRILSKESDAQMFATTGQIDVMQTASRIYLRENLENLRYNTTIVRGESLVDMLEPYGLPLGFVPITTFNQDISLVINKTPDTVAAHLEITGGDLSDMQRAELVRRVGFYASRDDDKTIRIIVPLDEIFSQIVARHDDDPDKSGFLSDLDMGGFGIEAGSDILARNGEFETLQTNSLALFGTEDGRKIRSRIQNLIANKSVFQTGVGDAALSITRGILNIGNLSARTIAAFGDTGNFTADDASVFDLSLAAGRTAFEGPAKWDIRGDVITDNIYFTTERLEISSSLNASRGQDVFISGDLEYNANTGIETGIIRTANITLRDQTSDALLGDKSGAVILDIRPADTSLLPDALVDSVNNSLFAIIDEPSDSGGDTTDCKSIISRLNATYNEKSLSQNIICQYVFWQRLEKRIDIKQCLQNGGGNC